LVQFNVEFLVMTESVRVLELFSGIGGMRCGLTEGLGPSVQCSFISVDMNEFCNEVYRSSFGDKPLNRDICSIPLGWFEKLAASIWTMSPPCQPYTRQGNQEDADDDRAKPLTYITHEILAKLENLPKHIILENVKNFELSVSYRELVSVLSSRGYSMRGFLLNPLYMGFPNSRLRFFLAATWTGRGNSSVPILSNDPIQCSEYSQIATPVALTRRIGDFLCTNHTNGAYGVPRSILEKKAAFCFDVVSAKSRQCLCFTRAYTKYIDGTGSVLLGEEFVDCDVDDMDRPILKNLTSMSELDGRIRYFCPAEAARLNGFSVNGIPGKSLAFPTDCSGGKKFYRAVGNSLNPLVVAFIVRELDIC
jgi:tRNA (cytosine38-C5)-methyltransferase